MIVNFAAWKEAATALGLRMTPEENGLMVGRVTLHGTIDGVDVSVAWMDGPFVAMATTPPRLDLGLAVRPVGIRSALSTLFGGADVKIGDADFDDAFDVRADEPDRAKALLAPSVTSALKIVAKENVFVDDEKVTIRRLGGVSGASVEELVWMGKTCAQLANRLIAARGAVPPAADLAEHLASWKAFASAQGLAFRPTPLAFEGTIGRAKIRATAIRIGPGKHVVELGALFSSPLEVMLHVDPHAPLDFLEALTAAGTLMTTGDHAFDRVFKVTATPASIALLDADVRASLLHLASHGAASLHPNGVYVRRTMPNDPTEIVALVEDVGAVIDHVEAKARGGGYR